METEIVELYQLIQHVEDKLSSDFSNKEYSEFLIQNLPTTRYPYSVYCDIRQAAFDCLQFIRNNQNQLDDREHIYLLYYALNSFDIQVKDNSRGELVVFEPVQNGLKLVLRSPTFWETLEKKPGARPRNPKKFGTIFLYQKSRALKLHTLEALCDGNNPLFDTSLKFGMFRMNRHLNLNWKYTRCIDEPRKTYGLRATEVIDREHYHQNIDSVLKQVEEQSLNFVCLPELLICDDGLDKIKQFLQNWQQEFILFVAGSFHRQQDEKWYNRMPILLKYRNTIHQLNYDKEVAAFDRVSSFCKQDGTPPENIEMPDPVYFQNLQQSESFFSEDIENDRQLLVLRTGHFGNFGFLICKDYLEEDLLHEAYLPVVDHLVVISLNTSNSATFFEIAKTKSKSNKIATMYLNTYCFDPHLLTPSFIHTPNVSNGQPDSIVNDHASEAIFWEMPTYLNVN